MTINFVIWKAFRGWLEQHLAYLADLQEQNPQMKQVYLQGLEDEINGCNELLELMIDPRCQNIDECIPFKGELIQLPWMCTFPRSFSLFRDKALCYKFDQDHPVGRRVEVLCYFLEKLSHHWPRETRVLEGIKVHAIALQDKYYHRVQHFDKLGATLEQERQWRAQMDIWSRVFMRAQDAIGVAKFIRFKMGLPVHDIGSTRKPGAQENLNYRRLQPLCQENWTSHDPVAMKNDQVNHEEIQKIGLSDRVVNQLRDDADEMIDRVFDDFSDVSMKEKELFFVFANMDFWTSSENVVPDESHPFLDPLFDNRRSKEWWKFKNVGRLELKIVAGLSGLYEEPGHDFFLDSLEGDEFEQLEEASEDDIRFGDWTGYWFDLYIQRLDDECNTIDASRQLEPIARYYDSNESEGENGESEGEISDMYGPDPDQDDQRYSEESEAYSE
ncbi:hypothetical protein H2198_007500 [Neophaeococcomyces mojaviensis]|uniref:Uncharacterized protein n=1 Tax=Neophaeococcomyces mojaviensis TaxID=3383035 RepID=A0ACC3A0A8_9EURO|nr:hypothetical protein H2198_007500 [Knufia sp. JES_112]